MRFPVSRRGLLTAGVGGLSLGLLTACGLRLDQDPEIPTLDSTQQLRNRLARVLDSTSPGAGDPETAGEDLADFVAAVGPVWRPPPEFATEKPPTEEERTFVQAAEVAARAVFEASSSLGSGLIAVLADAATGLTLVAGTKKPELITTADELIRTGRDELDRNTGGKRTQDSKQDGDEEQDDRAKVFNAILNRSRAAAYGYERLAVNFEAKSRERNGALTRLESLGALSGEMLELLGEDAADPAASAWKLDPTPTDADSAKELALSLEDGIASALLPWLEADASAMLRLWESARSRTVFADPQPLRFTYDEPGQAEVQE
ncbi:MULTISPECIES: hypothetical protein [unclassified Brevibacterium]|uniref:hypothetical protein n=1 Tax=unclassified Brevibacterium TaxID=2614124 RepID=UPI001091B858|nr:hypothetical protein [Brevibacterium sp. S22]TGD28452.1 hypothetical protein EB835_17620 [Brevibacterium sp. S22]